MPDVIKRWCECNPDRAQKIGRAIRLWLAYLGLVTFGGLITGPIVYAWAEGQMTQMRADQTAELQRMQDINRQLLLIIEQRLPAIAETAREAADTAKDAAVRAGTAGRTANTAASAAKAAASAAGQAAKRVDDAVTPVPAAPAEVPAWLDTP